MHKFKCHQLAVQFYQEAKKCRLPSYLNNQLLRAASSVALNLSEGWGKGISKDRLRFWKIALGSIRECESIAALEPLAFSRQQKELLNHLAGATVKLLHNAPSSLP